MDGLEEMILMLSNDAVLSRNNHNILTVLTRYSALGLLLILCVRHICVEFIFRINLLLHTFLAKDIIMHIIK